MTGRRFTFEDVTGRELRTITAALTSVRPEVVRLLGLGYLVPEHVACPACGQPTRRTEGALR